MIRTVLLFFLIFGIVVISHEFGHYLIGRKNGIRVVEFSVGMGPVLFHYVKNGTRYSLRLLPIGGACMFDGEDGDFMPGAEKENPILENEGIAFTQANVWKRIATVFAGPFFNFLLAYMFALIIVACTGEDKPVITGFMENSPAQEAGLEIGDIITRIDHESIHFYREVSLISSLNQGESVTIQYIRDGKKETTVITPVFDEETGRYYFGLVGSGEFFKCNPLQVFGYSFHEVGYWVKATYKGLGMLFTGQASKDDVAGPIGIAKMVGDTYEEVKPYGLSSVILTMMNLVVLLSVNLGILNLLPLPALDGGRLIFMFIEVLRGKPIPPEKEGIVHFAGLVAFMILMVFVMFNDIMRLLQ